MAVLLEAGVEEASPEDSAEAASGAEEAAVDFAAAEEASEAAERAGAGKSR
jgi:hypothetical protein